MYTFEASSNAFRMNNPEAGLLFSTLPRPLPPDALVVSVLLAHGSASFIFSTTLYLLPQDIIIA